MAPAPRALRLDSAIDELALHVLEMAQVFEHAPAMATCAPSSAKSRAVVSPIPEAPQVKELLGMPAEVETAALIPLGYPLGKFRRPPRGPLAEVAHASSRIGDP